MAEKKISDLNSLLAVSGGAIIPIVAGDTTYKVTVQELKLYTDQGLALTSSNIPFGGTNTFSSTQNFNGAVFLNGDVNIVGNVIGGIRNEINGLEGYTASLKGQTILSSSAQIAGNISGSFTSLSSSITNRLVVVENSISSDNSLLNIFSSSVNTTTSSLIGITNGLMAYTASLKGQAIVSSSQQITNLGFISSSQTINTGSLVTTSSFNLYTASQSTASLVDRLNSIESVTGSLNSYTASLKGAIEISGQDVNVLGMITAQQFNVTYVSSSTLYQSGSTKFGDTSDDRHEFTGSILVGGEVLGNSGLNQFTSSQNLVNLGISIVTGSLNTQTGSQDSVNLGISTFTGSLRSEIDLIEAYTASLKGAAIVSSSTQISNYYKFAETSSGNTFYGNQTISGSFLVSGSTGFIGVHTLSGSNTIVGNTLMTGTNTIIGNTELSGSIDVSGSSNFHNSIFIVTGSQFYTGSSDFKGNKTITGSLNVNGDINVVSGSGFYRWGNKLFNYGQWSSLETQTGSANTAYAMKLEVPATEFEGIYVGNNVSGFPTRIYVENNGLYNIQFSAQLHTTQNNEECDFSVWFAMTGSNIDNSNTDFSIEKTTGGGFQLAALNFLTPITSGSYVELYWSTTTANGQLQYKGTQTTPIRPATPSVIVTVTQIA